MKAGEAILAIVTGIIGLAIIAVIFGSNSQTSSVISAGGTALSSLINAAVQPVTGGSATMGGINL